jgi:hypothetical protein
MKSVAETFLSKLDSAVRWTGIPTRVADQMSDAPLLDRKHQPLRWRPIVPIALSSGLFILCLNWPLALNQLRLGAVIIGMQVSFLALVPVIHTLGPLGKLSLEDDEREAALRRYSLLFCLGVLAWLNCLGQPFLMILSHVQDWRTAHSVSVAASAFVLNATLFGCLPTLYASWKLRRLPKE